MVVYIDIFYGVASPKSSIRRPGAGCGRGSAPVEEDRGRSWPGRQLGGHLPSARQRRRPPENHGSIICAMCSRPPPRHKRVDPVPIPRRSSSHTSSPAHSRPPKSESENPRLILQGRSPKGAHEDAGAICHLRSRRADGPGAEADSAAATRPSFSSTAQKKWQAGFKPDPSRIPACVFLAIPKR